MNDTLLAAAQDAVGSYPDPVLGRELAAADAVHSLEVTDGQATTEIRLPLPADRYGPILAAALEERLTALDGVESAAVTVNWDVPRGPVAAGREPIPGVRNIVAIASGKGGVGKSTTTVNLALALAAEGATVGIMDADIYGPSQPKMLGLSGRRPTSVDGQRLEPLVAHGIQCMSIGFLVGEDDPMVWRGPMATSALNQLLGQTDWRDLDYLLVDMPPGTGDIQLTLSQQVPVSGAVIVTTPQDIALLDAMKGLMMFKKVSIPVLGIVENMSVHVCSNCGHREPIFGEGGGGRLSERYEVPLLGALPLDIRIREETDDGRPTVAVDPDAPVAAAYIDTARRMAAVLADVSGNAAAPFPNIVMEDD
jgi:ATP-binding protein involved in chromosome partitioning